MDVFSVLHYLKDKHEDEIKHLAEAMAAGGCQDFEEYKERVGRIKGLEAAISEIQDLAANMDEPLKD